MLIGLRGLDSRGPQVVDGARTVGNRLTHHATLGSFRPKASGLLAVRLNLHLHDRTVLALFLTRHTIPGPGRVTDVQYWEGIWSPKSGQLWTLQNGLGPTI